MSKNVLITGIAGQDGSFLAEQLTAAGYSVHGIVRRSALESPTDRLFRLQGINNQIQLHAIDVENFSAVYQLTQKIPFVHCYHLAAESFVADGFAENFSTVSRNLNSTFVLLEALRLHSPNCRFFFAGSSEMFGSSTTSPQNEHTLMSPLSAYGFSKMYGYQLCRLYRSNYKMFCATGILYNHESERRSKEYVSKKIVRGVARIALGLDSKLTLGNLDSARDWGHSPDYTRAMRLMLEHHEPCDFIIATGKQRTVREFCEIAFRYVGLEYLKHIESNHNLVRKNDSKTLVGDASEITRTLKWERTITFEEMVHKMVDFELAVCKDESAGTLKTNLKAS